jgi:putative membrane protein
MIVKAPQNTLTLLFTLDGSIVPAIISKIVFAAVIGCIACIIGTDVLEVREGLQLSDHFYDFTPFAVFGIAISLFLGFRNNACYDRWWEARKQWGQQLITVRNLSRMLLAVAHTDSKEAVLMIRYASAHSHALRHQLRGDATAIKDRNTFLQSADIDKLDGSPNAADAILHLAASCLHTMKEIHAIDSIELVGIEKYLRELGQVQGACERLVSTPVPFPYRLLVLRTVWLYILLAPFAMVQNCGWFTPVIMSIVAYVFFGYDELSCQLENPFSDKSQHSIPLEALCRTIDISTAAALGIKPPRPLEPAGRYLN